MKIDYVIPFVDGSDPYWREVYSRYSSEPRESRSRDWDILRYQLRSVEKYLSWVNNIYIVLSIGKTQIPKWLNTKHPKVRIVYDWEIVPKEYLPTFNSNVVELFFPRIKGLSEHYLTSCDDYLLLTSRREDDFYKDTNTIKLKIDEVEFDKNIYGSSVINSTKLIYPSYLKTNGDKVKTYWANHTITPHIKSINEALLNKYEKEIIKSCTKFREKENLTWLIYPLNMMKLNRLISSSIDVFIYKLKTTDDSANLVFPNSDVIVLNDWYNGKEFDVAKELLIEKMENRFSEKSEFEL